MKLTITKALLCIAALLFTQSLRAQDQDYLLTLKGDTLFGKVSQSSVDHTKFKYKTAKMKKAEDITVDSIKEFTCNRIPLVMRAVTMEGVKKPVFMIVVEKGAISLYSLMEWNAMESNRIHSSMEFYVSKNCDSVRLLKSNYNTDKPKEQILDEFAELLKDKKSIYDKFKAKEYYNFTYLFKLIHFYNTGLTL
ncbi:hypothetical protein SAMN05216464_112107 [Mucilaginibacter pineti]|uniref:Uncharacterized protein n=1 Tax=Mucilaginibacter pineti TaxID=1391627 RepID=A0A1G7I0U3_9SPHI|nr:hypothetical protein [Mucilaginibacter pineti]SDF06352.1 hypothetical protein SAMN05216464_112107 [Mucilaginibacter pineti]